MGVPQPWQLGKVAEGDQEHDDQDPDHDGAFDAHGF